MNTEPWYINQRDRNNDAEKRCNDAGNSDEGQNIQRQSEFKRNKVYFLSSVMLLWRGHWQAVIQILQETTRNGSLVQ